MLKKLNYKIIFLFLFLGSFALLFIQEGPFRKSTYSYSSLVPPDLLFEDTWYGVYFQESYIGYSNFFMKVKDAQDGGGYLLKNKSRLNFPLLGKIEPLNMDMEVNLFSNYTLNNGEFRMQAGNYFFNAELIAKENDVYDLTIETPSQKETRTIKRDKKIINFMFSPVSFNYIPIKKNISYTFYDPILDRETSVFLENKGKVNIESGGESIEVYKVILDVEGTNGVLFVDKNGRLLKEEFLGFTFVREDTDQLFSRTIPTANKDLINSFSIPVIKIPEKEKLDYLKAEIKGIEPEHIKKDFNQNVSSSNDGLIVEIFRKVPQKINNTPVNQNDFSEFLQENAYIKFNNPIVKNRVSSIIGNEKDNYTIIKKFSAWIDSNINKTPSITLPNTLDVLKLKQGDCGELSALMVGFLRCAGIPSYVNIGIVYSEDRFFYHAWVSAYIGEWFDTDPALNQLIADPTHIKLLTGFENQFELFKIISKIKVEIIEYR